MATDVPRESDMTVQSTAPPLIPLKSSNAPSRIYTTDCNTVIVHRHPIEASANGAPTVILRSTAKQAFNTPTADPLNGAVWAKNA